MYLKVHEAVPVSHLQLLPCIPTIVHLSNTQVCSLEILEGHRHHSIRMSLCGVCGWCVRRVGMCVCVGWGNTCTVIPYYLFVKNLCKITKKIDHITIAFWQRVYKLPVLGFLILFFRSDTLAKFAMLDARNTFIRYLLSIGIGYR